jgi:hypothetical protein
VAVDQAEHRRVDGNRQPARRACEQTATRVDDLPARRRELDRPEGLLLRGRGEARPLEDLQRPEPEREEAEQRERREPDDRDAQIEAGAAVEVADDDRNRSQPEPARDANAAAAGWIRDEVAQRLQGSARGTSRPLRRTT